MDRTPPDHPLRLRSYDGWSLEAALHLDSTYPGFLAGSFASSSLKRQAHFAAFAVIIQEDPADIAQRLRKHAPPHVVVTSSNPLAQIAQYLLTLRARRILEAVYGSCPRGLVGILRRVGASPISPDPGLYRLAWSLFAEPQHRERAKLLMQAQGYIAARRIRVVSYLDGILLRRAVLDRISSPGDVLSLIEAVRLIQALVPDATDDRLAQSLDALGPYKGNLRSRSQGLSACVLRWLERMECAPLPGPFHPSDPEFRLLVGKALIDAGRRYRNCLKQHLGYVAAGRKLFYRWQGQPCAIVELNCFSDGMGQTFYAVGQIRGIDNVQPPIAVLNAIRARLCAAGVLFNGAAIGQRAPLHGLLRILDDEEPSDAYVSYLHELEELVEIDGMEAA